MVTEMDRFIEKFRDYTDINTILDDDWTNTLEDLAFEASFVLWVSDSAVTEAVDETMYQMASHYAKGEPWKGIGMYHECIGKTIRKVWCSEKQTIPFLHYTAPDGREGSRLEGPLFFQYEDGILRISEYGMLWIDDHLPEEPLQDISGLLPELTGKRIEKCQLHMSILSEEDYRKSLTLNTLHFDMIILSETIDKETHRTYHTVFHP